MGAEKSLGPWWGEEPKVRRETKLPRGMWQRSTRRCCEQLGRVSIDGKFDFEGRKSS